LIRKPEVVDGVKTNPSPFIVNMEWDTLPAQLDSTGFYSYEDIWDNLGSHACVADPNYPSAINDIGAQGTLNIYPNPVTDEQFTVSSDKMIKSIQLYDLIGQLIYSENYNTPISKTEVAISEKFHGIYLVTVTFENNSTTTQKIFVK